jgi:hypothetical protein
MFSAFTVEYRNMSRRKTLFFQKVAHIAFGGGLHVYSKRVFARKHFLRQSKFWKMTMGYHDLL